MEIEGGIFLSIVRKVGREAEGEGWEEAEGGKLSLGFGEVFCDVGNVVMEIDRVGRGSEIGGRGLCSGGAEGGEWGVEVSLSV